MYEVCRDSVDGCSTRVMSTPDTLEDAIDLAETGAEYWNRRYVVINPETDRVVFETSPAN